MNGAFHLLPPSVCLELNGKGTAIFIQAWTGSEGSRRFRPRRISRQLAHEGGKVVSPTHRPPLTPGNNSGSHSVRG